MRALWGKLWFAPLIAEVERFRDDDGRVDFAALGRSEYEFRRALATGDFSKSERAREIVEAAETEFDVRHDRSTAGANARWGKSAEVPAEEPKATAKRKPSGPMPSDKQKVYDFAIEEGLDVADAYECWECTVNERNGKTADGKRIRDWKAYVRRWCASRTARRSA
jgi:hypothetical protein